jgi:hypothetical protein
MNNFQISYNYLKTAFKRKNVPFPQELATILEPPATTMTTTQSSNNSTAAVRCFMAEQSFCSVLHIFISLFILKT